ncbi:CHC2 zinc finger domain-containing protein [Duncaniella dubosii]|uniref:CHC2 zinc finger domain-containing protein n=1 Tax=Duncaniella dubosii TaxID=2518971 RepID=UPI001E639914|nr:CHC2 zinc finger domain-containing protein [Duncaniella dubosii]
MFKEIKTIPLATFMSRLGHEPVRRSGDKLWYKSPLRQEHTPSFKVETTLNCWYDFGIGKGGNIVDLAAEIYQSTDMRYLIHCIADSCPMPSMQTVAPLLLHDTLPRVLRTFELCRWRVTHLSLTYKSVAFQRRFQRLIANRFITVVEANNIILLPLPTSQMAMRYATDISKVAYRRKTSPYGAYAMARQRNVQCLKDLLTICRH